MTKYTVIKDDLGRESIERIDDDGKVWVIPIDEANSDYQAYLNPVEHLTSPLTNEPAGNVVQ